MFPVSKNRKRNGFLFLLIQSGEWLQKPKLSAQFLAFVFFFYKRWFDNPNLGSKIF